MIRLLVATLLVASFSVVAEVTLTDINNNEVADAEEVMGNFNALKQGVEANATAIDALPTPPTNCTADQIIKWDDTNEVWVCADMPSVNVSEPANRYKWEYAGWSGSSPSFSPLTNGTFMAFGAPLDMYLQFSMNGQSGESVFAPIQHMDAKVGLGLVCFIVLSPASASNGVIEAYVDEVEEVAGSGSTLGWYIGVDGGVNAYAFGNLVLGETYSLEFLD
jgi:hypothetical protein